MYQSRVSRKRQAVEVPIAMGHSATAFKAGEPTMLVIACCWLASSFPLTVNFQQRMFLQEEDIAPFAGDLTVHQAS